jgi:phasin family protein
MNQAETGKTAPQQLMSEFTKLFEQFKLPGIDLNAVLESRRKDIDALAAANRTALEGAQSLAQKQLDVLRTTIDEVQSMLKQSKDVPAPAAARELVSQAVQRAFTNMRELADVAYRSQSEAVAVVSRRVQENIEELKTLVHAKK